MSHDPISATFDDWADSGRDVSMQEGHGDVVVQVIEGLEIAAGARILDLGCGNGWATRLLAQKAPGTQAIGIDVSAKMIARADELHSFTIRARYDLGTFEALDFADDSFDNAFSMEALYYSPNLEQAISELARVLKPGGRADILLDYYSERPGTEQWAEGMELALRRLSEAEWAEAFRQAGFERVETDRVRDRRGPGEEAEFEPSRWYADWAARVAYSEAGSLWIRAWR